MEFEKVVKLKDVIDLIAKINGNDLDIVINELNNLETISTYDELEKLFPYNIGDTIYEVSYFWDDPCVREYKVDTISKCFLIQQNYGRIFFLTKEESELY
jgi:hypothetical protein